jgi:hypothetical protein
VPIKIFTRPKLPTATIRTMKTRRGPLMERKGVDIDRLPGPQEPFPGANPSLHGDPGDIFSLKLAPVEPKSHFSSAQHGITARAWGMFHVKHACPAAPLCASQSPVAPSAHETSAFTRPQQRRSSRSSSSLHRRVPPGRVWPTGHSPSTVTWRVVTGECTGRRGRTGLEAGGVAPRASGAPRHARLSVPGVSRAQFARIAVLGGAQNGNCADMAPN